MKISETTCYPHPLLAPWSNDISGAFFSTDISYREDITSQQLSIRTDSELNNSDILQLIENGSAKFGCFIRCKDTGFRKVLPLGFPVGLHDFAPGALLGRVEVRPMIWTTKEILSYLPTGSHPEFHAALVQPGQIIALGDQLALNVTRPPLPSVESIFEIDIDPSLNEGYFDVDMGDDRVIVRMAQDTFSLLQSLRQTNSSSKSVVRTSFFVPVLMHILGQIKKNGDQFEGLRWHNSFSEKCEALSIDMDNPDLINSALKLLDCPFKDLECLLSSKED